MKMSKLFKKDTKQFINALHKLTDERFSFNIVHSCNDVVSYCQYDCYYDVNLKGV